MFATNRLSAAARTGASGWRARRDRPRLLLAGLVLLAALAGGRWLIAAAGGWFGTPAVHIVTHAAPAGGR